VTQDEIQRLPRHQDSRTVARTHSPRHDAGISLFTSTGPARLGLFVCWVAGSERWRAVPKLPTRSTLHPGNRLGFSFRAHDTPVDSCHNSARASHSWKKGRCLRSRVFVLSWCGAKQWRSFVPCA